MRSLIRLLAVLCLALCVSSADCLETKKHTRREIPAATAPEALPAAQSGAAYAPASTPMKPLLVLPQCIIAPHTPAWLNVDCSSGSFKFTGTAPAVTKDETTSLTVVAFDGNGKRQDYPFSLTVKAPPPTLAATEYAKASLQQTLPVREGATMLAGTVVDLPPNADKLSLQVWSYPQGHPELQTPLPLITTAPATATQIAMTGSAYTVTLASPLDGGNVVKLYAVKADGTRVATLLTKSLPAAIPVGSMALQVDQPLKVDALTISGSVGPLPFPLVPATAATAVTATAAANLGSVGNVPAIVLWATDPVSGDWSLLAPAAGTAQPTPVDKTGRFSITLATKLVAGQQIRVDVVPPAGRSFRGLSPLMPPVPGQHFVTQLSREFKVLSNISLSQPTISTSPFYEGVATLTGTATIPSATVPLGVAVLRLHGTAPGMRRGTGECLVLNQLNGQQDLGVLLPLTNSTGNPFLGSLDASSGTYKVVLTQGLKQDEWVQVVQVLPAGVSVSDRQLGNCASPPQRVDYPFDFYRTNIDFTAGLLLSSSSASSTTNADFSQANQFYALNVDHAWALPGYDCIGGRRWGRAQVGTGRDTGACKSTQVPQWRSRGVGFSSFFDARLTSIPISTPAATTTNTTTATTSTTATASTAPSTLLTSQKVFRVETGAYFPIVVGHGQGEHPNSLFFAPLAKAGFDTVTGAGTSNNVILPGGGTGTLNFQTAYKYYAYGARIGNMTQSRSSNRDPQVEHYLDVTVGRYSNLQSYICRLAKDGSGITVDLPGTSCHVNDPIGFPLKSIVADSRKQLYRLDFEGLIKIPIPATAIPFYIGFNANISQHTVGATGLDQAYAPPDDIRILFATRIDIGSLLATFKQIGSF